MVFEKPSAVAKITGQFHAMDATMFRRLVRPLWLLLAAIFLVEAWLWDRLTDFGHWLRDRLPFEAFKRGVAALVARMPAWGALLLFAIPVIIVQPLKLAALWLMMHGHVMLGALGFVGVKIVGFGAVAFLFDLTREKLMTFRWFVWVFDHVNWLRGKASAFIAPYKAALKWRMSILKAAAFRIFGLGGDRRSMLARLRSRVRR
jgi:hypothetical protein